MKSNSFFTEKLKKRNIKLNRYNFIPLNLINIIFLTFINFIHEDINISSKIVQRNFSNISKILFFIITIKDSSRSPIVHNRWVPYLENKTKIDQVYYISTNGCYSDKLRCISPPDRIQKILNSKNWGNSHQNVDRAAKRVSAADFLVNHQNFEWVVTITDDVIVNVDRLSLMIDELNQIGDPKTTPIFKGHCIETDYCYNNSCIQGGSGHIMSLETAKRFIQIGDNWISTCNYADDDHLSIAIKDMNMSLTEVSSPYFVGLNIYHSQYQYLINNQYNYISKCPKNFYNHKCKYGFQPINKLIFINMDSWSRTQEVYPHLFKFHPNSIQWYQNRDPLICQQDF